MARLTAAEWVARENNCTEPEADHMLEEDPDLEYEYYLRYCLQELNLSPDEIIRGFGNETSDAQERFIEDFKGEDELEVEQ
ncbi:MAG: hypothetical protein KDC45_04180 [Bacteroidetes bacterium]|nr:hypothetical protein [Bacteroidota bacterium]